MSSIFVKLSKGDLAIWNFYLNLGCKRYEITNHLGNVMTVINDRKTPVPLSAPFEDVAEYFMPTILIETDYFPFGMQLFDPATLTLDEDYRFGFGGHELDNEIKGTGNHYSFGDYGYDPRLGRRWNVDPVDKPWESSYATLSNNPTIFVDPDGKDAIILTWPTYPSGGYPLTGHTGVLLIDNTTGYTRYYEYGRYDQDDFGEVRTYPVPNVVMGEDGRPTAESLHNVLAVISKTSATVHKGSDKEKTYDLVGSYFISDQFEEMKAYADQRLSEGNERRRYSVRNNNCGNFACDVVTSADDVNRRGVNLANWFNILPSTLSIDLQLFDDFTIRHSTERGYTDVGRSDTYQVPERQD